MKKEKTTQKYVKKLVTFGYWESKNSTKVTKAYRYHVLLEGAEDGIDCRKFISIKFSFMHIYNLEIA